MKTHPLTAVSFAPQRTRLMSALLIGTCLGLSACSSGHATASNSVTGPFEAPTGTVGPSTLNVADAAIAGGDPNMALSVSQSILSSDPNNVNALVHEGDAYYALDRCPAAMAAFQQALNNDAHSAPAETGLGRCLLKTNPAAAEQAFDGAVQDDPGNAAALNDLGIARDLQGNFTGATDPFQKSLLANPSSTATEVNLGLSLALSGQGPEALQYLGPLANGSDATAKIREDYAAALVASGRDDEARQILAVDLTPDQVNQAVEGFSALISASIQNPPPPAPMPTTPVVQTAEPVSTAPIVATPAVAASTPVPLMPAAAPVQAPAPAPAATPGTGMSPDTIAIPQPAPPPAPAPVAVATPAPAAMAAHQAPTPLMPEAAAPMPAPAPMPEQTASAGDGTVQVQLGAYGSHGEASRAWSNISGSAPGLFGDKSPVYETAHVHGKTYVRLRVGGFDDKPTAAKFCAELSSAGSACTVANF